MMRDAAIYSPPSISPRVCSRPQVAQGISEPTTNHAPRSAAHHPCCSSPPRLCSLDPELPVYHFLPQQEHSFFHPLPALPEPTGWLPGRIQPGQTPAQPAQSWLLGDTDSPHALEAGILESPLPCTARLRPPGKASALRMLQAPLGQQCTHSWRRHRHVAESDPGPFPNHRHCLHPQLS